LSAEKDTNRLLESILLSAKALTHADGGTIYTVTDDATLKFEMLATDSLNISMGGTTGNPIPFPAIPLYINGEPNSGTIVSHAVLKGSTINIPDVYATLDYDLSGTKAIDENNNYHTRSLLTIPLKNHEGDIIGVLQLINAMSDGEVVEFSRVSQSIAEALASLAAVALTKKRLIDDMRTLFDAFTRLIATAIDEKSPYTGGHCRRVPELTMMLTEAASNCQAGPLKDFELDEADRYEIHVASWLHDCGKVATPEYVMDKATKLETIYDRIGLVEARFEIARRDVEIDYYKQVLEAMREDRMDDIALYDELKRTVISSLDEQLAFIQKTNIGGEFLSEEAQQRVADIATRTWFNREGESKPLLEDEEVANLQIARGTLNEEERNIINNHIVVTIDMLESLPFPKHLKNVPEIAGGHHEKMDGTGYPKGLTREQMSVPARAMAIADVFEALTAADRPYKKAKALTECLTIMGRMRENQHIDGDLFDVFIDSGVYKKYAEEFLLPEQIDDVNLDAIIGYVPRHRRQEQIH
ncbi:MAG: HD domain-containing phosphohydrolase, partial [Pseudomonadota bacterium]